MTFGCVFDDALIFDGGLILYICVVP